MGFSVRWWPEEKRLRLSRAEGILPPNFYRLKNETLIFLCVSSLQVFRLASPKNHVSKFLKITFCTYKERTSYPVGYISLETLTNKLRKLINWMRCLIIFNCDETGSVRRKCPLEPTQGREVVLAMRLGTNVMRV